MCTCIFLAMTGHDVESLEWELMALVFFESELVMRWSHWSEN